MKSLNRFLLMWNIVLVGAWLGATQALKCDFTSTACEYTSQSSSDFKWRWRSVEGAPQECIFPFKYMGQDYNICTEKDSKFNRSWCSTTSDYAKDKQWVYCTPDTYSGKPCIFPFKYKENNSSKTSQKCVSYNGKMGCAIQTKGNGMVETWDYCVTGTWNAITTSQSNQTAYLISKPYAMEACKMKVTTAFSSAEMGNIYISINNQIVGHILPTKFKGTTTETELRIGNQVFDKIPFQVKFGVTNTVINRVYSIYSIEYLKCDCEDKPCRNGASCTTRKSTYTCQCLAGFSGKRCEHNINKCQSNPCKYGKCTDLINGYNCTCKAGWTGINCDNFDDCASKPCHYGKCLELMNAGYACSCDFTKSTCGYNSTQNVSDVFSRWKWTSDEAIRKDVMTYAGTPCVFPFTYKNTQKISCQKSNKGDWCAITSNYDTDQRWAYCVKGWNIIQSKNMEKLFSSSYAMEACAMTITAEFSSNMTDMVVKINNLTVGSIVPSNNDGIGRQTKFKIKEQTYGKIPFQVSFEVKNAAEGKKIYSVYSVEIESCSCSDGPCENGGNCSTGASAGYVCSCPLGLTGKRCENDINECLSNPCENGACTNLLNKYRCLCDSGWSGDVCTKNIDECASNPCIHGNCTDLVNGFTCSCESGWTGQMCANNIDECLSNPCQNGMCIDNVNGYQCKCPDGELPLNNTCVKDYCYDKPCYIGNCVNRHMGHQCICEDNWGGLNCSEYHNDKCTCSKEIQETNARYNGLTLQFLLLQRQYYSMQNEMKETKNYGCPSGSVRYKSSCYYFEHSSDSWKNAQDICTSKMANLLSIENKEESQFIARFLLLNFGTLKTPTGWWTGGRTVGVNQWTWVGTGREMVYSSWPENRPLSWIRRGGCLYLLKEGSSFIWKDMPCDLSGSFICEIVLT